MTSHLAIPRLFPSPLAVLLHSTCTLQSACFRKVHFLPPFYPLSTPFQPLPVPFPPAPPPTVVVCSRSLPWQSPLYCWCTVETLVLTTSFSSPVTVTHSLFTMSWTNNRGRLQNTLLRVNCTMCVPRTYDITVIAHLCTMRGFLQRLTIYQQ